MLRLRLRPKGRTRTRLGADGCSGAAAAAAALLARPLEELDGPAIGSCSTAESEPFVRRTRMATDGLVGRAPVASAHWQWARFACCWLLLVVASLALCVPAGSQQEGAANLANKSDSSIGSFATFADNSTSGRRVASREEAAKVKEARAAGQRHRRADEGAARRADEEAPERVARKVEEEAREPNGRTFAGKCCSSGD